MRQRPALLRRRDARRRDTSSPCWSPWSLPRSAAVERGGASGAGCGGGARGRRVFLSNEVPSATDGETCRGAVGGLDFDALRTEFEELARSAGAQIAATLVQRRARPDAATLVGQGKLEEIAGVAASTGAQVVLFDHDLTPSQLRNLEAKLPCRVIDRTQLILDIFARHARTREGQLQVELAQLEYQLPRLAGHGKAMSQLGGGIGTRGPGETQLETDRRKINLRIDHVKEQLESVRRIRRQQRQRRESVPVPVVALVGYTNAGKSTLFNALTEAGVLESSKMFATLDPKLKLLQLPSRRQILISDTVGFIRNLPHTLVTSFRATLEEVERAEVLLHVRDASSAMVDEQKLQVEKVLGELEVKGKPVIEVMNKIDLLPPQERARLAVGAGVQTSGASVAIPVSGLRKTGLRSCWRPSTRRWWWIRWWRRASACRSRRAQCWPRWRRARWCARRASKGTGASYGARAGVAAGALSASFAREN